MVKGIFSREVKEKNQIPNFQIQNNDHCYETSLFFNQGMCKCLPQVRISTKFVSKKIFKSSRYIHQARIKKEGKRFR